jgi:hypothetical protein
MLKIKFLSARRSPALIRAADNSAWLQTPLGMPTRAGSGPAGATCLTCAHFDLSQSRWSDYGRCAPCLEARRFLPGKADPPPVPARWAACSRFQPRPDAAAVFAAADQRLDDRVVEKRAKIDALQHAIKRLQGEISELHEEQRDAQGARSAPEDGGEDSEWKEFEPDFRGDGP